MDVGVHTAEVYWPDEHTRQLLHAVAPAIVEYVRPVWQLVHTASAVEVPAEAWNVPAAQVVHVCDVFVVHHEFAGQAAG